MTHFENQSAVDPEAAVDGTSIDEEAVVDETAEHATPELVLDAEPADVADQSRIVEVDDEP